jgi:hypothetical protein
MNDKRSGAEALKLYGEFAGVQYLRNTANSLP